VGPEDLVGFAPGVELQWCEPLRFDFDLELTFRGRSLGAPPALLEFGGPLGRCSCGAPARAAVRRLAFGRMQLTGRCSSCRGEEPAEAADEGLLVTSSHPAFAADFYRYLHLFRQGFGLRAEPRSRPGAPALLLPSADEDVVRRLLQAWRDRRLGQTRAASSSLLRRHYEDDLQHGLTTQDGRVGFLGSPYVQKFRRGKRGFLAMARSGLPEVVESARDLASF
jgi:hypothetical protein